MLLLATWVLAAANFSSSPEADLALLTRAQREIPLNDFAALADTLDSPEPAVQLASLRFWGHADVAKAYQEMRLIRMGYTLRPEIHLPDLEAIEKHIADSTDRLVESPNAEIHSEAVRTLAALGAETWHIGQTCGNVDYAYDEESVKRLEKRADRLQSELLTLLDDPSARVAWNAGLQIDKAHSEAAQAKMKRLLTSKDPAIRLIAMSLGDPPEDQAKIEFYATMRKDPDETVSRVANLRLEFIDLTPSQLFQSRNRYRLPARQWIAERVAERPSEPKEGEPDPRPERRSQLRQLFQDPRPSDSGHRARRFTTGRHDPGGDPPPLSRSASTSWPSRRDPRVRSSQSFRHPLNP